MVMASDSARAFARAGASADVRVFRNLTAQDIRESCEQGEAAARMALQGETGVMPAIERIQDEPYSYRVVSRRLEEIANQARRVPREWINEAGNDVTEDFARYARPLILGEQENEWQDGLPLYLPVDHLA